jgi:hypothetical protein
VYDGARREKLSNLVRAHRVGRKRGDLGGANQVRAYGLEPDSAVLGASLLRLAHRPNQVHAFALGG